jgi:hypothetical protein
VKHIKRDSKLKDNIKNLVDYISDKRGSTERVQDTRITNCSCKDLASAVLEMQIVQAMNKNKNNKTYHMIVSFQNDEKPTREQIRNVEDELVKSLGYEDHQRISVLHGDTDNWHLHIAINKIDPKTFKSKNPYGDYRILKKKRRELEKKFGFKTNVKDLQQELEQEYKELNNNKTNTKAADFEAQTGLKSFNTFMKKIAPELKNCKSWKEFNEVLASNGVEIKVRGNGFIFTSNDNHVKASSVDRVFSKKKLEDKFGSFEKSKNEVIKDKGYRPEPIDEQHEIVHEFHYRKEQYNKDKKVSKEIKDVLEVNKLLNSHLLKQEGNPQIRDLLNSLYRWFISIQIKQIKEKYEKQKLSFSNLPSYKRKKNRQIEKEKSFLKLLNLRKGKQLYEFIRNKLKLRNNIFNRIPKAFVAQKCVHKLPKRNMERSKRKGRGIL